MGISHLYLSPILESMPESNHGYDALDPSRVSDERGGEKQLVDLFTKVKKQKSIEGVILDIVPNHVAASTLNPYWWDVLKLGPESKFYKFFDIRARANGDKRLVLPVLGKKLRSVLASKELHLAVKDGEVVLKYWDKFLPLNPSTVDKSYLSMTAKELKTVSLKTVEQILNRQSYLLADWKTGSREINYRRFFDINDLAAIRVEHEDVFDWDHAKIRELIEKFDLVHGLRVDHVDGLTQPEDYLHRLKTLTPNIWVEKIVGDGETIPKSWPINGTTGYEFSNQAARLFVDLPGLQHLHAHYTRNVDRRWERFHECVYDSKREILETHFVSELDYLVDSLYAESAAARKEADFTKDDLHLALTELTSSLRVYRTYAKKGESIQSRFLEAALAEAEGRGRITQPAAFEWLRSVLLAPGDWSDSVFALIKRWEQLSGPVMAKGLEDTALYRYFPHLSLNGVGGEPDWTGDGAIEFHAANREKLRSEPLTMNASSTHDTKRSEDVRARLAVVSELADEWTELFDSLATDDGLDGTTQYLIYETIVGAWPLDGKLDKTFIERLKAYFLKAVREAKSATSWSDPDENYEKSVFQCVEDILKPKTAKSKRNLERLKAFAEKCAYFGAWNSLSALALKTLSPGLPDFYQGTEMWDLSLVDPDNRRPVDYDLRKATLKRIKADAKSAARTLKKRAVTQWKSGEVKLWITHALLQFKKAHANLFVQGEYYPLDPIGDGRRHYLGFARHLEGKWALVVVPRFMACALGQTKKPRPWMKEPLRFEKEMLETVRFELPPQAASQWRNVMTGKVLDGQSLKTQELLDGLPVGIWESVEA